MFFKKTLNLSFYKSRITNGMREGFAVKPRMNMQTRDPSLFEENMTQAKVRCNPLLRIISSDESRLINLQSKGVFVCLQPGISAYAFKFHLSSLSLERII